MSGNGAITRAPLNMIKGQGAGQVISEGRTLRVESGTTVDDVEFGGHYESTSGILTLSIPDHGKLRISGFLTPNSIPTQSRTPSEKGRDGLDGTMGLDGRTGDTGCRGQEGPRGITGARGVRGHQGERGHTGSTGATGEKGSDGKILVFVQDSDPGPVGAFALWIKPTNNLI